jgi:hypothetical protein
MIIADEKTHEKTMKYLFKTKVKEKLNIPQLSGGTNQLICSIFRRNTGTATFLKTETLYSGCLQILPVQEVITYHYNIQP